MEEETFKSLSEEDLKAHEFNIDQKLLVIDQKLARLRTQKTQLLQWKDEIQKVRTERRTNQRAGENWENENYAWSAQARQALRNVFGLEDFRPQQLKVINALMSRQDVLLLAPTGGGKSLCFQLPAIISKGITVVISPLVSLMEDQVWAMRKLNIVAQMLCSFTEKENVNEIHKDLNQKKAPIMKLLYVTPERMSKSKRFMTALQKCYNNGHLDRFAIDEVHCCSQWGHDFRPDYKFLGVLKGLFPNVPLIGVTATATTKVIIDVQKMLNIPDAFVVKATFNRPNLYYHVLEKPQEKKEQYELLSNLLLDRFRQKSGIIYTFSTKDTIDISAEMKQRGLKVAPYHASLEAADRTKIHQLWLKNELQAVVATVAFGMGINKSDVRFIIHHTLSKSLENYYQESGRAGRDGQKAECILLYHFSDIFRISTMTFSEHSGLRNAYAMVEYCINVSECRRKIISRYFSEVWGEEECDAMCDRCANKEHALHPNVDIIKLVEQVTTIITNASQKEMKLTGLRVVDAWMHKGPVFLRLSEPPPPYDRAVAEQIVAFLVVEGYLKESFTYTPYATISYLVLGHPVIGNSLMLRLGKLFDLPAPQQESQTSEESQSRKSVSKKRSLPPEPTKTVKNAKSQATPKPAKRPKVAPPVEGDKTITSTSGHSNGEVDNSEDADVVILPTAEEIIEIDGD